MQRRGAGGFTLLEVMMVVVIIGILASIAVYSYGPEVMRGRRSDGRVALVSAAQTLERCYTEFSAYDHVDCPLTFPFTAESGYYEVDAVRTAGTYTLTATPQGPQASDACGALTLDQTGLKGSTGTATRCW
jgi:type IV pilus assembly protein PilE